MLLGLVEVVALEVIMVEQVEHLKLVPCPLVVVMVDKLTLLGLMGSMVLPMVLAELVV